MLQTGMRRQRQTLHLINYKKENIKMKKYINISYLLASLFVLLTACSEEIFSPNTLGDNVTLSLSYSDVSPKEIKVNTRATDAEERHLNNLYIYIFDANGKLKGFKAIEGETNLDQNTNNSKKAEINGIKTRAGESYIYAVANVNTGLYPVATSTGTIESGKLPIGLDEEYAQAGKYNFTLDQLKSLKFIRAKEDEIQISSAFLMSGAVLNGNLVTITESGAVSGGDDAIKLSRIVSKVRFTIKAASGNNRKFTLSNYGIKNISMNGGLIGKADGNEEVTSPSSNTYSDRTGLVRGTNDKDANGAEFFEVYLPENLQQAKNPVKDWHAREDDSESLDKKFTNAPEYGTYVVLNGKYEESVNGVNRTADVTYYVHLGDCSVDKNDYNVERNCKYTFNVTVAGVDKIIVEANKKGNEQPGAEGVIMEYGKAGKTLQLDSHYDYMVMRFYQKDIKELKKDGLGYYYQVYALGKHTGAMNVAHGTTGNLNDVDTSWIEFAINNGNSQSEYSTKSNEKGTPCNYPGIGKTYTIEKFLKELYDNAETDSYWTKGSGTNRYIDATCFVSENYYSNLNWNEYVNDVSKRSFYVANAVEISKDTRSVYATTQYGLQQYNIQTFYDRRQAGSVVAYGCETINDEEGKNFSVKGGNPNSTNNKAKTEWNGRINMLKDISINSAWANIASNKSLEIACLSRNRDLNGNGKIDEDEIRWYAPSMDQYAGLWIGEEVLSTESKLFNKETSILTTQGENGRMLYYTSTGKQNTFFSEEGMATNNFNSSSSNEYPPKYVRCIRNLKSKDIGYAETPDKYYSFNSGTNLVKLDKVDAKALETTTEQGELNSHEERSELNKPASAFYIAPDVLNKGYENKKVNGILQQVLIGPTQEEVVNGTYKCSGNYSEGNKTWRVPNQREMSIMFLLGSKYIDGTYCRTKFSNFNFRKSWTFADVYTMSDHWSTPGSIRCISVAK